MLLIFSKTEVPCSLKEKFKKRTTVNFVERYNYSVGELKYTGFAIHGLAIQITV